jgi:glucan phosphoethanolaminetransferase (alkaline phosphatase superfamily)
MQQYKNHQRLVLSYHGLTWLPTIALLIGSIINLVNSSEENLYSASLILLIALVIVSILLHARSFALKAQDRAIRAEENLRHFVLTGRPLDARLTLAQVIALRFASDEEFPALAQRAADESLSNKSIKKEVKTWRADYHRV